MKKIILLLLILTTACFNTKTPSVNDRFLIKLINRTTNHSKLQNNFSYVFLSQSIGCSGCTRQVFNRLTNKPHDSIIVFQFAETRVLPSQVKSSISKNKNFYLLTSEDLNEILKLKLELPFIFRKTSVGFETKAIKIDEIDKLFISIDSGID